MSATLNEFCDVINTYGGRDKVMKVLCYTAKLLSGLNATKNPKMAKNYAIFSSKISGARATLRLIDDIPMIQYALEYGLGKTENDSKMAIMGVTANIIDLLYYPIEKICWLLEHNLLNVEDPSMWDKLSSMFWVASIYLNLMRTIRNFTNNEEKKNLCKTTTSREAFEKIIKKQRLEMISILRLSLDFTHAVSTLPKGYLWGGKLKTWQVGFIGTFSAFLGIYQIYAKRRLSK